MHFVVIVLIITSLLHLSSAFSSTTPSPHAQLVLPPKLQAAHAADKGLLIRPLPNVYLLGTVHIGSDSAEEARVLIDTVKPKAVVVEVAPSRVATIRKRNEAAKKARNNESNNDGDESLSTSSKSNDPGVLLKSLPALAEKGWSTGGIAGLLFATTIIWGSLLKRSFTAQEETDTLPRADEFAAAIEAADAIGASVIPCDVELEELIGNVVRSLSPLGWMSLALNVAAETIGLREVDPIRRRRGESVVDWAMRRRDIATARASRLHGEELSAGLNKALVDDRDERFARYCQKVIELSEDMTGVGDAIVCVVGLVHVDGVAKRLQDNTQVETAG